MDLRQLIQHMPGNTRPGISVHAKLPFERTAHRVDRGRWIDPIGRCPISLWNMVMAAQELPYRQAQPSRRHAELCEVLLPEFAPARGAIRSPSPRLAVAEPNKVSQRFGTTEVGDDVELGRQVRVWEAPMSPAAVRPAERSPWDARQRTAQQTGPGAVGCGRESRRDPLVAFNWSIVSAGLTGETNRPAASSQWNWS